MASSPLNGEPSHLGSARVLACSFTRLAGNIFSLTPGLSPVLTGADDKTVSTVLVISLAEAFDNSPHPGRTIGSE